MPEFHVNSDGEVMIQGRISPAGSIVAPSPDNAHLPEGGADHEFQDGSIPSDAGFGDLHPESLRRVAEDCARFQAENAATLESVYGRELCSRSGSYEYGAADAGRDFWFTRCGHGVCFWDRGLGYAGDVLSEAARRFGEIYASWGTAVDLPGRFVFVE